MNSKFIKKGIVVAAIAGVFFTPTAQALAAEAASILTMPKQNKESQLDDKALLNAVAEMSDTTNIEKTLKIESGAEIKLNEILSKKVFVKVGEAGYLQVNETTEETSTCVGKVYTDSTIIIEERASDWTKIVSGNLVGYIKTEYVITGKETVQKGKEILGAKYPDTDLTTLDKETIENSFSWGETIEEETARIAAEEAKRIEEEQVRIAAEAAARQIELETKGQAVIEYAKQFLGNPYVYGGTSLTRGTDCSGFVRGVYAHFGISMPRSSYYMRNAGYEVSYSEIMPGDVICYSGHVGIYAGDGKIINAIDESRGIGFSNARYAKIITIRRMF